MANDKKDVQLALRVNGQLIEALDREVQRQKKKRPGLSLNRSDVARDCLHRCLKARGPV